jgi:tetratricopeptide (TPR) repeat protein
MEPMKIVVDSHGKVTHYDAQILFEKGNQYLKHHQWKKAVKVYEKLIKEFPKSKLTPLAYYNTALCLQKMGWFQSALNFYEPLLYLKDFPWQKQVLFKKSTCLLELHEWTKALQLYQKILRRKDLSPEEQIKFMALKCKVLFELKHYQTAKKTCQQTLAYNKKIEFMVRLKSPYYLAMAHYYLAEIKRQHFRSIKFILPVQKMKKDLEKKAKLLLEAQAAYISTIKVGEPHWATVSGYRVGMLYSEFYNHILAAEIPPELDSTAREIYFEELHKLIKPLIEKAIRIWEKTLLMAERVGINNEWTKEVNKEIQRLRLLLSQKEGS